MTAKRETCRCPVCDCLFFPRRSDAVYCGSTCRKRAQRARTNKATSPEQALYRQMMNHIHTLQGLGAGRQLRTLALSIIQQLPDAERSRLYDALTDDIHRIKRDG